MCMNVLRDFIYIYIYVCVCVSMDVIEPLDGCDWCVNVHDDIVYILCAIDHKYELFWGGQFNSRRLCKADES
jgi:hypothetical protein